MRCAEHSDGQSLLQDERPSSMGVSPWLVALEDRPLSLITLQNEANQMRLAHAAIEGCAAHRRFCDQPAALIHKSAERVKCEAIAARCLAPAAARAPSLQIMSPKMRQLQRQRELKSQVLRSGTQIARTPRSWLNGKQNVVRV